METSLTEEEKVLSNLKELLGSDLLRTYSLSGNRFGIVINPNRVTDVASYLVKKVGARLAYITPTGIGLDGFEVSYIYGLDHLTKKFRIIVKTEVSNENPTLPSVTPITWQANWAEREAAEFVGIKFQNHPDPRHQWLPYEWPNPTESGKYDETTFGAVDKTHDEVRSDFKRWVPLSINPSDASASIIPIGPYHPATVEGQYVRLKVDGEIVLDVDIKVGFSHRGIIKLIERRAYSRSIFLAERVCGICSGAHGLAYVTAIENLSSVDVPERALYIRTLLAELNRVQSHLLWFGLLCDIAGFKTGFMLSWAFRERALDAIEAITGNRVTYGIWRVGGVSRDVPEELVEKVKKQISKIKEDAKRFADEILDHPVLKARLIDVGTLDYSTAFDAGAVGPVARGSGWKVDIRMSDPPHAIYDPSIISWQVILEEGRDCYARMMVRLRELFVSLDICSQVLDALKKVKGDIVSKPAKFEEGTEAIGVNEAPRGELLYYVKAGKMNTAETARIRTPSYRNNACLPFMMRGYTLADAPVIMGSIDQCLSCTDRMEIIDVKTEKVKIETWDGLVKKSLKKF